jgi:hypothetical protein
MLISDIKEMDKIVSQNDDLHWDGWNVVRVVQDDYAEYQSVGFYNRAMGKWYRRDIYQLDVLGWEIPDSVVGNEK